MVGLDVTHKALLRKPHVERLARTGGTAGKLVAELHGFYAEHHRRAYDWDGAPVHDAVAVGQVIDGTLLETKGCGVIVDTGPEPSRGRTYVDLRGSAGWAENCHVAVAIDAERFLELLIERIAGLG
jgi:pyrimidine-specific ribonucleoside hydrolase